MKQFIIPPEINELLQIREAEIIELEKELKELKESSDLFARLAFYEGRLVNHKSSSYYNTKIFEYPTYEGWKRGDKKLSYKQNIEQQKEHFSILKLSPAYSNSLPETYEETLNNKGEYSEEYRWLLLTKL